METPYLFVYGTLQSGYGNNCLLKNSKKVSSAVTQDLMVLYHVGFPIMRRKDILMSKAYSVLGELYEVDEYDLKRCDQLEGHPNWYERKIIPIVISGGEKDGVVVKSFSYLQDNYEGKNYCQVVNNLYRWTR